MFDGNGCMINQLTLRQGMAETALAKLQEQHADLLEVYYARIGMTFRQTTFAPDFLLWGMAMNREDKLAASMIELAKNGNENKTFGPRELGQIEIKLRSQ
jgi:hypothetical protein